jgi:hypothetical protein
MDVHLLHHMLLGSDRETVLKKVLFVISSRLLGNPQFYYRVHKNQRLDHTVTNFSPIYNLISSLFQMKFNLSSHLCVCLTNGLIYLGFPTNLYGYLNSGNFLDTASRPALGPNQTPMQWVM